MDKRVWTLKDLIRMSEPRGVKGLRGDVGIQSLFYGSTRDG